MLRFFWFSYRFLFQRESLIPKLYTLKKNERVM